MHFRSQRKSASDVSLSDYIETGKDGNALSLMDVVGQEDDLFDRLFAVLPEFGLRAFQRPSGQDLGTLRADLSAETEKMPGTDDRAAR